MADQDRPSDEGRSPGSSPQEQPRADAERAEAERADAERAEAERADAERADAEREAPEDVQSGAGAPQAPVLVSPQEGTLLDSDDVTLRWEAMEGVETYLVEVAEDAPFHEVVIQREVQGDALPLEGLSTGGALYYWRVLVKQDGEWSHGDNIESFRSVSAEQAHRAEQGGASPDQGEGYGPAAELVSAAGAEASAEAMGSEAQLAREREMGVAHEGVESGQIIGLAGLVLLCIIIIACILFFWVTSVSRTTRDERTGASVYPTLQKSETQAAQQLHQYELVSERDSTYRIPIDEAMRIVTDETYQRSGRRAQQRYSNQLPMDLPVPSDSLRPNAFVPQPSAPKGTAGSL